MDDILKHREDIKNNILKSFQVDLQKSEENDIEKARSGVYSDTAENRKLSRVGQKYGSKKNDVIETRYNNGQLQSRTTYKDGKLNGLREEWHDNGQPGIRETYKDGKLEGLRETWDKDGKLKESATYKDGVKQ